MNQYVQKSIKNSEEISTHTVYYQMMNNCVYTCLKRVKQEFSTV